VAGLQQGGGTNGDSRVGLSGKRNKQPAPGCTRGQLSRKGKGADPRNNKKKTGGSPALVFGRTGVFCGGRANNAKLPTRQGPLTRRGVGSGGTKRPPDGGRIWAETASRFQIGASQGHFISRFTLLQAAGKQFFSRQVNPWLKENTHRVPVDLAPSIIWGASSDGEVRFGTALLFWGTIPTPREKGVGSGGINLGGLCSGEKRAKQHIFTVGLVGGAAPYGLAKPPCCGFHEVAPCPMGNTLPPGRSGGS